MTHDSTNQTKSIWCVCLCVRIAYICIAIWMMSSALMSKAKNSLCPFLFFLQNIQFALRLWQEIYIGSDLIRNFQATPISLESYFFSIISSPVCVAMGRGVAVCEGFHIINDNHKNCGLNGNPYRDRETLCRAHSIRQTTPIWFLPYLIWVCVHTNSVNACEVLKPDGRLNEWVSQKVLVWWVSKRCMMIQKVNKRTKTNAASVNEYHWYDKTKATPPKKQQTTEELKIAFRPYRMQTQ